MSTVSSFSVSGSPGSWGTIPKTQPLMPNSKTSTCHPCRPKAVSKASTLLLVAPRNKPPRPHNQISEDGTNTYRKNSDYWEVARTLVPRKGVLLASIKGTFYACARSEPHPTTQVDAMREGEASRRQSGFRV